MSILDRFATIIKANINELLDKAEDPAKMVDQYLIDLGDSLAKVKEETAGVMAEEKRCQRLVDDNEAEAKRMEDLAKKQQLEANGEELKKAADDAHANADRMRQMRDKFVSDIEQLKARRESIKAKSTVAKTQTMVNELASGTDKAAGAIDAFNRMEAKVDKQLDTAESLAELNEKPADDVETLEAKYAGIADSAAVDEELAKLKAEMGL